MFNLIDGLQKPFKPGIENYGENAMKVAEEMSKGVGSSKELAITRIIDRIQGVENSQRRMLHVLDMYKREVPKDAYGKHLNETVKEVLLKATSADHTMKLNTDNNPKYYQDIMKTGWEAPINESTKKAGEKAGGVEKGNIFERFEKYLQRMLDLAGQNDIDYKKSDHRVGRAIKEFYNVNSLTRLQNYNLVAQNPIDFFKKSAKTRFENQKWLRIASGIGGAVLLATVLAQFTFGKIKNPHNIQKQVSDDKNS